MFSELIDSCIQRSGRKDRQADIIDYANTTIRECQTLALFHRDLVEETVLATAEPTVWTLPNTFRQMRVVLYPDGMYPDYMMPGKQQKYLDRYYYAASGYMVFVGCGTQGATTLSQVIKLAYYSYLPRLKYYAVGSRPAVYDDETNAWTYNPVTTDPDEQAAARAKVSNWLLTHYNEMIKEGTLAKLFKSIKDQERSMMSYSLYKSMQEDIKKAEGFESLGK